MGIVWLIVQVLVGAMALFFLSHAIYTACMNKPILVWLLSLAAMSFSVMGVHKLIGSTVNPPFFTLMLFAASTYGHFLYPNPVKTKALWAISIGGIAGWMLYIHSSSVLQGAL